MAAQATDTANVIEASGRSGAACTVSGPYRSNRNAAVVVFMVAGSKFPVDTDGAATTWTLLTDTVTQVAEI